MKRALPRQELLRRARVAVLDDETPEVLRDLVAAGLSVDHLKSVDDQRFPRLEEGFYDLLLLDFGGVGVKFGADEGLDILRHLNRVCPALRVLSFTGRTFDSSKADFFRNTHSVLKKDAGVRETLEVVEKNLSEVLTPAHQFNALVKLLELQQDSKEAKKLEKLIYEYSGKQGERGDIAAAAQKIGLFLGSKAAEVAIVKIVELIIVAAIA